MKKILLAMLLLVCAAALSACGASETSGNQEPAEQPVVEQTAETVSKAASDQDWVYDAPLDYGKVLPPSYTTAGGDTIYATDIVVPFLNISSADARALNLQFMDEGEDLLEDYRELAAEGIWYHKSAYNWWVHDGLLSVLMNVTSGGTDVPSSEYYAAVIDLADGSQVRYPQLYQRLGYDEASVNTAVKVAISSYITEDLGLADLDQSLIDRYVAESYEDYLDDLKDGEVRACLNDKGQLIVYVEVEADAVGSGVFPTMLVLQ